MCVLARCSYKDIFASGQVSIDFIIDLLIS